MKIGCLLLALALSPLLADDGQFIIDTKFDAPAAFGKAILPVADSELPLKSPTGIGVSAPSVFEPGQESVGEINPPYALAKVASRENQVEAPANLHIQWDVKGVPLEPGRYQLTVQIGIIESMGDAGNFVLNMLDADGKVLNQGDLPRVAFGAGKISSVPNKVVPFSAGDRYTLEILVDTVQLTWSASVNGEPLRDELPLAPAVQESLNGGCRLAGFSYFSVGGANNSKPGSSVALYDVKLVRLK